MIDLFILSHASTYDCLDMSIFQTKDIQARRIACGLSKPTKEYDLSEVSDFFPSYASLNSSIFESSIILTVWEHLEALCKGSHIGFLHTDIKPFYKKNELWNNIKRDLKDPQVTLGISFPLEYENAQFNTWDLDGRFVLKPSVDPMLHNRFDLEKSIWDVIRRIDPSIYDFAMSSDPPMIYSHMFITTLRTFQSLGARLRNALEKLSAAELGLWTPHLFERLVGIYLSHLSVVKNVCAFKHYAGSSPLKPSSFSLYGSRSYKHYKTSRKTFI